MNDSATKNSNTAVFIFAVPKHTKKRTILLRMRRTLGKTPNQLDALETTALFATSFPGFFFVKYVVTLEDAVDRTPIAIQVVPLIIDRSNQSEYVGGWTDILMQQRSLENATG